MQRMAAWLAGRAPDLRSFTFQHWPAVEWDEVVLASVLAALPPSLRTLRLHAPNLPITHNGGLGWTLSCAARCHMLSL